MKMPKVSNKTVKQAQDEIRKMKGKYVAAEKKAMEHVKKNPEMALLLAAGIGAAIGAITVAVIKSKKQQS
ncbi:MAG: hypothetical protein WC263_00930 [Candidatus Micrarchaeia archaeon]|jgi:ElaB/YqjD/DUF883 family membrane-anchored ribosome-binding protein